MKKNTVMMLLGLILVSSVQANPVCQAANDRFIINTDESTVTDSKTKLVWQRCSLGQTGNDCSGVPTGYTWSDALQTAKENHSGWRLPNLKELLSIIDEQCSEPAVNTFVFPNTQNFIYWSSSPDEMGNDDNARSVGFDDGTDYYSNKRGTYYVRLVRDEQ